MLPLPEKREGHQSRINGFTKGRKRAVRLLALHGSVFLFGNLQAAMRSTRQIGICKEGINAMDVTFLTDNGRFNYRVCAVIRNENKILAMHDERSPYYYLPGGRVRLHETAEHAVLREIKEELEVDAEIVRPLWLNESFFVEDVDHDQYHEICVYFLIDVSKTSLLTKGEKFVLYESERPHEFEWLEFERLKSEYFYPVFLKEKIFELPTHLELLSTFE